MTNCQLVAELLSRSLDGRLTLRQHLIVRLHIFRCVECGHHARQLWFLRAAARWPRPDLDANKRGNVGHKQRGDTSRK